MQYSTRHQVARAQHHSYTVHLYLLTRIQIVVSSRRPAQGCQGLPPFQPKLVNYSPLSKSQASTWAGTCLYGIKISNAAQSPRPGSRCSWALSSSPDFLPGFLPPSRSVVDLLITYSGAALASPASSSCSPRSPCLVGAASPKPKISFPNIPTWRPQHAHPTTHTIHIHIHIPPHQPKPIQSIPPRPTLHLVKNLPAYPPTPTAAQSVGGHNTTSLRPCFAPRQSCSH